MEAIEAFLDGEWESLSKLFSSDLPGGNFFTSADQTPSSSFFQLPPDHNLNPSFYCLSQESSNTFLQDFAADNTFQSMDLNNSSMEPDDFMEEILQLNDEETQQDHDSCKELMELKRKYEAQPSNPLQSSEDNQNPTKRPRVSKDGNKRNAQLRRKGKKAISNEDESSCSFEEDSNGGTTSESKGTGKAKGPATDPQSLYARKRRERINERLKILQSLVPNGTKVDISTMLEEAVHYVKFLQLQIKLLSSDEMWMFAPIAYNGMDMGLYHKINVL